MAPKLASFEEEIFARDSDKGKGKGKGGKDKGKGVGPYYGGGMGQAKGKGKPRCRGGMQILINTLTGDTFPLDVMAGNTIKKVKAQIQEMKGILLHQQRLIFAEQPLEDRHKLSDYYIQKESELTLLVTKGMHIFIKFRGVPRYALEVESSDLIEDVKMKIGDRDDLVDNHIRLAHYKGDNSDNIGSTRDYTSTGPLLMDDQQSLAHYNIVHGSVVHAWIPAHLEGLID